MESYEAYKTHLREVWYPAVDGQQKIEHNAILGDDSSHNALFNHFKTYLYFLCLLWFPLLCFYECVCICVFFLTIFSLFLFCVYFCLIFFFYFACFQKKERR